MKENPSGGFGCLVWPNGELDLPISIDIKSSSVFDYVTKIKATDGKVLGYNVNYWMGYHSKRYNKWVVIEKGDKSDGATDAPDIDSFAWLFHDELCATGKFYDGSTCTNLQASTVLADILKEEGHSFRRFTWFAATWLFGGGKARDNGLF